MDKRILRTRRILGNALVELLQETPLYRITVRQITERADVAYSTFFRNFETVEDLLDSYLDAFLTELHALVNDIEADNLHELSQQTVHLIFEHVSENQAMYRTILTTPAMRPALDPFKQELIARDLKMAEVLAELFRDNPPPLELLIYNAINDLFIMIEWYLEQESAPAIEAMVAYYEAIVIFPMWHLLLADETARRFLNIPPKK